MTMKLHLIRLTLVTLTALVLSEGTAAAQSCELSESLQGAREELDIALDTLEYGNGTDAELAEAAAKISGAIAHVGQRTPGYQALEYTLGNRGVDFSEQGQWEAAQTALSNKSILNQSSYSDAATFRGGSISEASAIAFKFAGRAFLAYGIAQSVHHVMAAPDHGQAAAEELGGWALSIQASEVAAAACVELGPGALLCAMAGGALGYAAGSKLGKAVWHTFEHPAACNSWKAICAIEYAITPPPVRVFQWVANHL